MSSSSRAHEVRGPEEESDKNLNQMEKKKEMEKVMKKNKIVMMGRMRMRMHWCTEDTQAKRCPNRMGG